MKLIIEDDEGRKTVVPFVRDEITIGRQEGNTIRLTERNVSRRHARLLRQNGHILVEDLGSYNGIRINGDRIQGQVQVNEGDLIQIGDYDLAVQREASEAAAHHPAPAASAQDATLDLAPHRNGTNGTSTTRPTLPDGATIPALPAVGGPGPAEEAEEANPEDVTLQPAAPPDDAAARRQSTAIIRMDQVEKNPTRQVTDIEPADAPRLVILNTELAGREFGCVRTELKIGRTDENDIAIDHRSLSRTHCKIVREDSGEWRVIDMQSANGLMVNGESYVQSALRSGDVLELGHVKVKFVGPGDKYDASEVIADADTGGGGGKGALVGVAAFVLLAAAGTGFWYLKFQRNTGPKPPLIVDRNPNGAHPVDPPKKGPETNPVELTIEQQRALGDAKIKEARQKIDALQWAEAISLLEDIVVGESPHPEAQRLIVDLKAEMPLLDAIEKANKLIDQDELKLAQELLDSAQHTKFAQGRHREVFERFTKATQAKLQQTASKEPGKTPTPPQPPPQPPPPKPTGQTARGQAEALMEEARASYKKKDKAGYLDAKIRLEKCVKVDKTYPECQMLLGATYGQLGDGPAGAKAYERFLELAPDHPKAAQVRALLEQYKQDSKGK